MKHGVIRTRVVFSLCILFRKRQLGFVENEDYRSHTRSLFYQWKTFGINDIDLNSMVFMFKDCAQCTEPGTVVVVQ